MIEYRNRLWPHIHHESVKTKFDHCTQTIDRKVKKFLKTNESQKLRSLKSKYQHLGSFLKTKHTPIPILFDNKSNPIVSDTEKAEHLASFFESTFTKSTPSQSHLPAQSSKSLDFVVFDEPSVYQALMSLKPANNASPDGIPAIFVKNCALSLAKPLSRIFKHAIMTGTLPDIWKQSIVTPIPKKPNLNSIENFRPISLLCPTSKAFEQIIHQNLVVHLEKNDFLPACQHGFRSGHSVTTQLLSVVDDLTLALGKKQCADVIYFDPSILSPTPFSSKNSLVLVYKVLS